MNLSGILVAVRPEALSECRAALAALPGVEVHFEDTGAGRLVVTQEAASVAEAVEGLKRIKTLPHVVLAEMVYHHVGDDHRTGDGASPPAALVE